MGIAVAGIAEARVIAMEPVPTTYRALLDNIAINNLQDRIQAIPAGAGEVLGMLHFSVNKGGSDRIVTDGTGQAIQIRSLDEVFTETPDMLVLDVEGFEPTVIKGASRLLADQKLKVVVVETLGLAADYGLDDKAMHNSMIGYGFETYHYAPSERRLQPANGMDPVNTIYIRDVEHVSQRLKTAPAFAVDGQVF